MINQWIINIVGIVILGILMDMIIPTGSIKAYTRFFIGLITILVIVQPLVGTLGQLTDYGDFPWFNSISKELDAIDSEGQTMAINQEKYLLELYRARLEEDITREVEKQIPEAHISVMVTLVDSEDENIFSIDRVHIIMTQSGDLRVRPVNISIGPKPQSQIEEIETNQGGKGWTVDYGKIKKHLQDTYEIDESRIYINTRE